MWASTREVLHDERTPTGAPGFGIPDLFGLGSALAEVLAHSHQLPPDRIPALAEDAARLGGGRGGRLWLIDYDLRRLVPFGSPASDESYDIEGTVAGRVYMR